MARRSNLSWALLVVILVGCAPGNTGLVIGNIVAPDDQGAYTVGNPALTRGTYDVSYGRGYFATFRVLNNLLDIGNDGTSGPPMANPNLIHVEQFYIETLDSTSAPTSIGGLTSEYAVPANSIVIPSSDGATAGEALATAEIFPTGYLEALRAAGDVTVVLSIQAVGRTSGDAVVISPEFTYPIDVCNGCLNVCARDEDGVQECRLSPTPGQDFVDYQCIGDVPPCVPGN
ncbi:MAG: hypothetical protein AB7S26_15670 [Sandaracinaceae bacterium]